MRFPGLALLFLASVTTVFAAPQTTAPAPQANQQSASANGVDSIIALVQANMSEGLVLKTIQRQNKAYDLTPDDLLKLQKAGVSERIINAMLDPSTASSASPTPAAAPPPTAAPPPAAAPSAAPAAPRAASAPGASSLVSSGPTGPGAASGAAGSGAAAKGGSASANARGGMSSGVFDGSAGPQPTGTEIRRVLLIQGPAERERPKDRGWLRRHHELRGRQGRADFGIAGQLSCRQRGGDTRADSFQRHFDGTSTATKPVTTTTTNANNSVSAAQSSAKKSATK